MQLDPDNPCAQVHSTPDGRKTLITGVVLLKSVPLPEMNVGSMLRVILNWVYDTMDGDMESLRRGLHQVWKTSNARAKMPTEDQVLHHIVKVITWCGIMTQL